MSAAAVTMPNGQTKREWRVRWIAEGTLGVQLSGDTNIIDNLVEARMVAEQHRARHDVGHRTLRVEILLDREVYEAWDRARWMAPGYWLYVSPVAAATARAPAASSACAAPLYPSVQAAIDAAVADGMRDPASPPMLRGGTFEPPHGTLLKNTVYSLHRHAWVDLEAVLPQLVAVGRRLGKVPPEECPRATKPPVVSLPNGLIGAVYGGDGWYFMTHEALFALPALGVPTIPTHGEIRRRKGTRRFEVYSGYADAWVKLTPEKLPDLAEHPSLYAHTRRKLGLPKPKARETPHVRRVDDGDEILYVVGLPGGWHNLDHQAILTWLASGAK